MQFLALDGTTGMAQSMHAGGQRQGKHQATADRPVLPENRSIALGGLDVHRPACALTHTPCAEYGSSRVYTTQACADFEKGVRYEPTPLRTG